MRNVLTRISFAQPTLNAEQMATLETISARMEMFTKPTKLGPVTTQAHQHHTAHKLMKTGYKQTAHPTRHVIMALAHRKT